MKNNLYGFNESTNSTLSKATSFWKQKKTCNDKKKFKILNIEIQINVFAAVLSCCITCNFAYYGYVFYGRSVLWFKNI